MIARIILFISIVSLFGCTSKPENDNMNVQATIVNDDQLHLSDQQIQLGHLVVDTIHTHSLGSELKLTGILVTNPNKITVISSRVMGRIEKLHVKNTGGKLLKGQAIYDLYSEDLNLTLRELKLALEKKKITPNSAFDIDKMISGARNKLILYGLSESQINELQKNESIPEWVTIKSPVDGIITSIDISEGNYVMEGGSILQIADYSSLWVEAQVFAEDLAKLKENMNAQVHIPDQPQLIIEGKVLFSNPELTTSSKINLVKIEILNPKNYLKPGMQVNISILLDAFDALALPTEAIILEEKGSSVWIQTGHNTYKNVMVHTGIESNGYTQVLHGLKKGDLAVVSGNYLLQSEFTFTTGNSSMSGHQH